jgi:hypothetical protein
MLKCRVKDKVPRKNSVIMIDNWIPFYGTFIIGILKLKSLQAHI